MMEAAQSLVPVPGEAETWQCEEAQARKVAGLLGGGTLLQGWDCTGHRWGRSGWKAASVQKARCTEETSREFLMSQTVDHCQEAKSQRMEKMLQRMAVLQLILNIRIKRENIRKVA